MDLHASFQQAVRILRLDEKVMAHLALDSKNHKPGPEFYHPILFFVFLGALASNLGEYFFPSHYGAVTYQLNLGEALLRSVMGTLMALVGLFVVGFFVERVFHAKVSMNGYVRVMAYASVVSVVNLFPPLAWLASIWLFVVFCFFLYRVGKLEPLAILLLLLLEGVVVLSLSLAWAFF